MMPLRKISMLAAVAALFAVPASAQTIDSVSTNQGTTGTIFTITGSGFGTAKPKVELVDPATGKKAKGSLLKVTENSDTSLTVEIKKATAGDFDLVVRPKGKGIEPATADGPFTIQPIQNVAPEAAAGDPGEEITVDADFMGTKKAKVKVGGKKAPVIAWEPTGNLIEGGPAGFFVFKVPQKLANGTYEIEIATKTATVIIPDFIEVENSDVGTGGGGAARFNCKLNGTTFKATPQTVVYASAPFGKTVLTNFSPTQASSSPKAFQFSLVYDPQNDGAATLDGGNIIIAAYTQGIFPNSTSYVGDGFVFNMNAPSANGQLTGTFSGTLNKLLGSGDDVLAVTDGVYTIDPPP